MSAPPRSELFYENPGVGWYDVMMHFLSKPLGFPKFTTVVSQAVGSSNVYAEFDLLFENKLPRVIRKHREFFKRDNRGFGEDAFHAMWFSVFIEFKPSTCLEIGVYRGQVISLWGLLSKSLGIKCEIYGLSPFEPIGDSVSTYLNDLDYVDDVKSNLRKFRINNVHLVQELSDAYKGRKFIQSKNWDLVYVDGSHDYETVRSDCAVSIAALRSGGLLVMDDAALYIEYTPTSGSFSGHPGPSKVATEIISGSLGEGQLQYLGNVGHNLVFRKK